MFCPQCKSEYRDGFYKCADCGCDLVYELEPEQQVFDNPVEVFSTYQQGEVAFIKSILEEEGIPYFFEGESPLLMIAAGAYARLFVNEKDADRVSELLAEMDKAIIEMEDS